MMPIVKNVFLSESLPLISIRHYLYSLHQTSYWYLPVFFICPMYSSPATPAVYTTSMKAFSTLVGMNFAFPLTYMFAFCLNIRSASIAAFSLILCCT